MGFHPGIVFGETGEIICTNMEEKEVPALGRPFKLGMLYDCRTNNLLSNTAIWDENSIESYTASQPQPLCDFDFTAEDTISAKTSFLDIQADLKLSVLFGMFEVHGSAKYLENHRKFTRQSRVTFKYRCRTHFKELQLNEIMSERKIHPGVLNLENATHVVAGILYGTDAIFVFDRTTTDEEDELENHKQLEAMVKLLPQFARGSSSGEGQNKLLDKVEISYHGDIPLDSEPKSFEEAIKAFKTLPSKIEKKGENCVPMHILLYPLHKLINKTCTLNEPLGVTLVNQIQDRFEKIEVLKMKCNDLTVRPTCEYDDTYRQKVDEMKATVEKSEQMLKSQFAREVIAVTSTNLAKGNVRNLLDEYDNSSKSPEKLDNNLSEMRTVINVLDTCVRKIPSSSNNSQSNTQNIGKFELPPIESFLGDLQKDDNCTAARRKQSIRSNISRIRKTMKKDINMFVSNFTDKESNHLELSIPLRPGKPSVIRRHDDTIKVSWLVPTNVLDDYSYEVSYRSRYSVNWQVWPYRLSNSYVIWPKHGWFTETSYFFRVRCICGGVFGQYSEISDPFLTLTDQCIIS